MTDTKFVDDCLSAINNYRSIHQVAPLTYNPDLEKLAQSWVQHLADTNSFSHNPKAVYRGKSLGENLAGKSTGDGRDITGGEIVDQWYSEIERYDFKRHGGPKTGHFTQLVWKASQEFGIGRTRTKDGMWLVCADFYPAGNYNNLDTENVFPPKDGKFPVVKKDHEDKDAGLSSRSNPFGHETGSHGCPAGTTKTQIRTETTGTGPNSVTRTITTETTTGPGGSVTQKTTEKVTYGTGKQEDTHPAQDDVRDQFSQLRMNKNEEIPPFNSDILAFHNDFRKFHSNTGGLTLNSDLSSLAQDWADHLARTKVLAHSNATYRGQAVGENVASKHGNYRVDYTGEEVVKQWYSEGSKFDYNNPEGQPGVKTGHFTQVVWKETNEIGVGKALSDDNRVYVVCLYHPAGNYIGCFKNNVGSLLK